MDTRRCQRSRWPHIRKWPARLVIRWKIWGIFSKRRWRAESKLTSWTTKIYHFSILHPLAGMNRQCGTISTTFEMEIYMPSAYTPSTVCFASWATTHYRSIPSHTNCSWMLWLWSMAYEQRKSLLDMRLDMHGSSTLIRCGLIRKSSPIRTSSMSNVFLSSLHFSHLLILRPGSVDELAFLSNSLSKAPLYVNWLPNYELLVSKCMCFGELQFPRTVL